MQSFKYVQSCEITGDTMTNITLALPEELHEKMKKHSDIRWSEVVRKSIEEKVKTLEILDKLTRKSKLSKKHIEEIAHRINKEVFNELNTG